MATPSTTHQFLQRLQWLVSTSVSVETDCFVIAGFDVSDAVDVGVVVGDDVSTSVVVVTSPFDILTILFISVAHSAIRRFLTVLNGFFSRPTSVLLTSDEGIKFSSSLAILPVRENSQRSEFRASTASSKVRKLQKMFWPKLEREISKLVKFKIML